MAIESSKEDRSEEIETLKNVKKFLTQKLKQNEEILKSNQKDLVLLNQELQKERRKNLNLSEKYLEIETEREEHKDNIKELNLRYENILKDNEGQIKKLTQEIKKARMHKKLIAQEVIKQREEIKKISGERDRFRDALIKIKSSFYQTNVFSQLKEASKKNAGEAKGEDTGEKESSGSTQMDDSVLTEENNNENGAKVD